MKEVSEESAKEKNTKHGNISTLHIWWARRPLASSRATNFAALIAAPTNPLETQRKKDFVVKISKLDTSLDRTILTEARRALLDLNGGMAPRVLDPFAGGGAIPLEALRLGCETYACDYNPVSTLILKCTLEYPQKYGSGSRETDYGLVSGKSKNQFLEDIKRWGKWVFDEAEKEIGQFYPKEKDGSIPLAYIWARTIPCQNPSCNATIPLMRRYWLVRKEARTIALYPYVVGKEVRFKIVGTGYEKIPRNFDPENGSVSKAIATCLVCGYVVDGSTMKRLFAGGNAGERMVAIVTRNDNLGVKEYRVAHDEDRVIYSRAEQYLQKKRKILLNEWGLDPIPDEPTPEGKGRGAERAFSVRNYSLNTWGDMFNSRQKLALLSFVEKIRQTYDRLVTEKVNEDYARVIVTYLALVFDRLATRNSNVCVWHHGSEQTEKVFALQALPMQWSYPESNPLVGENVTGFVGNMKSVLAVLERLCEMADTKFAEVSQCSATCLPYSNDFFDAVFTDPPYYDNIPYSYLSDFFYVWLKRCVGPLYPDLFSTPLSPKSEEIVAYSNTSGGWEAGKRFFEDMLRKSFREITRVLKPNGISTIVYAHKSTAGWETLVNSLLDSGLVVTGAWPIHTEMKGRMRTQESAALASSIYMIARKYRREKIGFYKEVKQELRQHLNSKLDYLWNEGISGADFFIAAIGSSIQVFGKYEKIIDDEGNVIRADKLLEDVRRVVTDYSVKQVLHNGFADEITPLTRFYVLWQWGYGDVKLEFDDAQKLAQGVGIDLPQAWNKGFIRKDKESISVLGPEDRKMADLENSTELIDVLHRVLLLWEKGRNDDVINVLKETGFGKSDVFYRVAQAIAQSLRNGKEKKLLEGFLSGKGRIAEQVVKESGQRRLFE